MKVVKKMTSKLAQIKQMISNDTLYSLLQHAAHPIMSLRYLWFMWRAPRPQVANTKQTLAYLNQHHLSVARYGDGEFRWMMNIKNDSFQDTTPELARRLQEIIKSNQANIMICLPDVFDGLQQYTRTNAGAWRHILSHYGFKIVKYLQPNKRYYDANFTRPYIDRRDKVQSEQFFAQIKHLWADRNVLIVEGAATRFGLSNDFLATARSVRRIICPSTNAFKQYAAILAQTKAIARPDDVILIALGPTATVLAYDLAQVGFWALDIGHADVEYDWFQAKATVRTPLKNKYVNELAAGHTVDNTNDKQYLQEIVAHIAQT
ncbi:hypothetical protein ATO00_10975 [Loigolactobacillus coryniformis subsp. coryniformis]|nr:hypothetical protein ATO00_10975 [Loigolactobacillus coryniformis subsp. coryniformis]